MTIYIKKKFIGNNQVDGAKILLLNNQAIRAENSSGAEVSLYKLNAANELQFMVNPKSDVAPSDARDLTRKDYVDAEDALEAAARAAADAELHDELDLEKLDRQAGDAAEAAAREAAIAAEAAAREAADAAEAAAREAADEAEAAARSLEDTRLQLEIDEETTRALAAEAAEAAARQAADAAEAAARQAGDAAAMAYTDSEILEHVTSKLAAPNGIATLDAFGRLSSSQIPAIGLTDVYVVTTLAERDALEVQEGDVAKVTQAVTSSDGTLLPRTYIYNGSQWIELNTESDVDSVAGKVGHVTLDTRDVMEFGDYRYYTPAREAEIEAQIDAEEARAMAREAELQAEIDAEEARALAREAELQAEIDAEEARALAREAELQAEIDAEEARALAREAELQAEIDAEEARAMAREDELEAMIDAEEARAVARENELEGMIDAEEARAMAREAELEAMIDAEEARAMAREAELQAEIDAEEATRASEDARVLSEAKQYTDEEILEHVTSKLAAANGIATLDAFGKLSSSQIPAISLTDVHVVTTLAERDALTVQEGDVVKVAQAVAASDGTMLPRTYLYDGSVWIEISADSDVDSVAGKVGHVTLDTRDVSEFGDYRYFTPAREAALEAMIDAEEARAIAREAELQSEIDAEEARAAAREAELQAEIDAEEAARAAEDAAIRAEIAAFKPVAPVKVVLSASDIANQYVELPVGSIVEYSVVANVDRLYLLPEELVESVVLGKVRLTFAGAIATGGEQALVAGDVLTLRYWVR